MKSFFFFIYLVSLGTILSPLPLYATSAGAGAGGAPGGVPLHIDYPPTSQQTQESQKFQKDLRGIQARLSEWVTNRNQLGQTGKASSENQRHQLTGIYDDLRGFRLYLLEVAMTNKVTSQQASLLARSLTSLYQTFHNIISSKKMGEDSNQDVAILFSDPSLPTVPSFKAIFAESNALSQSPLSYDQTTYTPQQVEELLGFQDYIDKAWYVLWRLRINDGKISPNDRWLFEQRQQLISEINQSLSQVDQRLAMDRQLLRLNNEDITSIKESLNKIIKPLVPNFKPLGSH